MVENLDASLKRMGIGHVDLFYSHVWDHRTPVVEIMRAFDDVIRSGKVCEVLTVVLTALCKHRRHSA